MSVSRTATPFQLLGIAMLPITILVVILSSRNSLKARSYLLSILPITFVVCSLGWECWWSLGWTGLSYSERHDDEKIWKEDIINAIAMVSGDCSIMLTCFVLTSFLADKFQKKSSKTLNISILILCILGVTQNCLMTLIIPVSVEDVGRAPLAPFAEEFGTFAVIDGKVLSIGNNIMWVLAPLVVLGLVGFPVTVEEEEEEGADLLAVHLL